MILESNLDMRKDYCTLAGKIHFIDMHNRELSCEENVLLAQITLMHPSE